MRLLLSAAVATLTLAFTHHVFAKDDSAKWEKEIAGIEARYVNKPVEKGGVVFIGSSSIRMWSTLAQDFPNQNVVNHGFGGSEVADSVFFADRLVFPFEPRLIVMYAGGNDINNGKTPEQVASDFRAFVEKVRQHLPEVAIDYISIAPNPARWAQIEKVRKANELIAAYCRDGSKLQYIDTHSQMLGSDSLPLPAIFREDKLHMNAEGYKIWTQVVGPYLEAK